MPEPTKAKPGPRPGAGGRPRGSTNASRGIPGKTAVLYVYAEPEVIAWAKANGGTRLLYPILKQLYINADAFDFDAYLLELEERVHHGDLMDVEPLDPDAPDDENGLNRH